MGSVTTALSELHSRSRAVELARSIDGAAPGPGHSVRLLTDYIETADFPLYNLLPIADIPLLDQLYVGQVWTALEDDTFVLGAEFDFAAGFNLSLPGFSQIRLNIGGGPPARGIARIGEKSSLRLDRLGLALELDPSLLLDPATGKGAQIATHGSVVVDGDGFRLTGFDKVSLGWAKVAGTELQVKLDGIMLGAGDLGLAVDEAAIRIPEAWGQKEGGGPIEFSATKLRVDKNGLSGAFRNSGTISTTLFGMAFTLEEAAIRFENGRLDEARLSGALDISKFASGGGTQWLDADFRISRDGVVAALRASDPPPAPDAEEDGDEAEDEAASQAAIATISFEKLLELKVRALRLEVSADAKHSTLWLSGALKLLFEDDWPELQFDELGIDNEGGLKLAGGASIATTAPFCVDWEIAQLTVTSFALERPRDRPTALELHLSAGVKLVDGIPAGASVEGLVVRWTPGGGDVIFSFDGIGVEFGVPGAFNAAARFSYEKGVGFRGEGALSIEALDMSLDVLVDIREAKGFNTFFLTAEAQVFPGGIPIGATALSLYGVSGLLAYNLSLKVDRTPPLKPRRYFDLFIEHDKKLGIPIGFATPDKWIADEGAAAIGLGVVVGTSDDGWMLSGRGALLVTLPELALFISATASLVAKREGMNSDKEGSLSALLAILPGEQLLRLDFAADWEMPPFFGVNARGGGEFRFNDPLAFKAYLGQAPERGSPVEARLLKLDEKWLVSAGFWFELDGFRQVRMGGYAPIELRIGTSSIYAELVGSLRADLRMAWGPIEVSGDGRAFGRARLSACGLTLSFTVDSHINVEIDDPLQIEIALTQCIEIDLLFDTIEICLSYSFSWTDHETPKAPLLPVDLSFRPRQWTPRPAIQPKVVDDGVVSALLSGKGAAQHLGPVHPHSVIMLGFPGSMTIDPALAAQVTFGLIKHPAPDRLSDISAYYTRRTLTGLELVDLTRPGQPVPLWTSFLRSPTEREDGAGNVGGGRPLQSLVGLWTSKRFSGDGSNSGAGVEDTPPINCTPQDAFTRTCIPLSGLIPGGSGVLRNGWAYRWDAPSFEHDPAVVRDVGPDLRQDEELRIWAPPGLAKVSIGSIDWDQRRQPRDRWRLLEKDVPAQDGLIIIAKWNGERILAELCWCEQIAASPSHPHDDVTDGASREEWDGRVADRILHPGHRYRLTMSLSSSIENGQAATVDRSDASHSVEFDVLPPPLWSDALSRAIVDTYPRDGLRPAYRHYDLVVQFEEDWVETLYQLAGRDLCARLLDADGKPIRDAAGNIALLPTAWREGPRGGSDTDRYWRDARLGNRCEPGARPGDPILVLPIAMKALGLSPLTRYIVELVAPLPTDRGSLTGDALAQWSFTTSRFADFADHAAQPVPPPVPRRYLQTVAMASNQFDNLARSFGAPTVLGAATMRIDLVTRGEDLVYLLIESPEPLDDGLNRLSVTIAPAGLTLVYNVDRTRAIAVLPAPVPIEDLGGSLEVSLAWDDAPDASKPATRRSIEGRLVARPILWTIKLDVLS